MDSLTQIALGIATAELYAGRKLQRKTWLYGALLGTLPDLDVAAGMMLNPIQGVALHRGLSHSMVFMLFVSPPLGWLIAKAERGKITRRSASLLVLWCLFTHVLLDVFTSWGTQVLWPLPYRLALKTIFVIDPLYTLPLIICLIIAWRKGSNFNLRKKYLLRGLYISSAYLIITCGLKLYALQKFEAALERQNIMYTDLIVKPTALNCILWNANVQTKDAYLLGDYSLFDTKPIAFSRYNKNNTLARQLSGNRDFEILKNVSEGWYIVTHKNGSYYFNDLRFGLLNTNTQNTQFAFSYIFIEEDGKLTAHEAPKQKRDGKALILRILERAKGN